MSAFKSFVAKAANAKPERVPAPRIIEVPPEAFVPTWSTRPKAGQMLKMGLKPLAAADVDEARRNASREASARYREPSERSQWVDCFNDAVMREVLALALCQPEDASLPFWEVAQSAVFIALTEGGVRLLWEAYGDLRAELDPIGEEATGPELHALAEALTAGDVWTRLTLERAQRARRLLRRAASLLG